MVFRLQDKEWQDDSQMGVEDRVWPLLAPMRHLPFYARDRRLWSGRLFLANVAPRSCLRRASWSGRSPCTASCLSVNHYVPPFTEVSAATFALVTSATTGTDRRIPWHAIFLFSASISLSILLMSPCRRYCCRVIFGPTHLKRGAKDEHGGIARRILPILQALAVPVASVWIPG